MPIHVDHEQRRAEIVKAAIAVLGDLGYAKFSLRAVGLRMGGSVTLVTHYFRTRDELLNAILESTLEDAREEQDRLLGIQDPEDRLEAVIRYFLPDDEIGMAQERARVSLSSHRNTEPLVREHLDYIEPMMREVIRVGIAAFTPEDKLESTVDVIRLWTSGVVLAAVEHPDMWPPGRQGEVLRQFRELLTVSRRGADATTSR